MPGQLTENSLSRRRARSAGHASGQENHVRATPRSRTSLPPVILMGGSANALSAARELSRQGVQVFAINKPDAAVCFSRCARSIRLPSDANYARHWADYLLGPDSESLRGSVLLAASDVGLRILAQFRDALRQKFLLDASDPAAQLTLLDKGCTYQAARNASVPTPKFWVIRDHHELNRIRDELVYPLLVKPRLSFQFTERFAGKFFVVHDFSQLQASRLAVDAAEVDTILVEQIPGPDTQLCSYYTYLDEQSDPQFHLTKRVLRRNPPNMGLGCYHVTDWTPEVRDWALQLLRHVRLQGLANVEFKWDTRDQTWKLIECNARLTEANTLLQRSGYPLATFVYNRIIGRPTPAFQRYKRGVRVWYPLEDSYAAWLLWSTGQLSLGEWLKSLVHRKHLPIFSWRDPVPSLHGLAHRGRNAWRAWRTSNR